MLSGYAFYMLCQWGMLVVLARLGSPEKVGAFALGLAVSTPVLLFTNLGLRRIQATDANREFRFRDFFVLRLLTILTALLVIGILIGVNGYRGQKAWVILAVGVGKAVEAVSDTVFGVLQQHERMDRISRSLLLRGGISLLSLAVVMAWTGSVLWAAVSLSFSWMAVLFLHDLPTIRHVIGPFRRATFFGWDSGALGRLVGLALPLGFVMMVGSLESSIPSLVIERKLGASTLGLYTALYYFLAASNRLTNALGEAGMPRLAAIYAQGDGQAFRRLLGRILGVAGGVGLVGVVGAFLLGKPLLRVLYGMDYARQADILTLIMIVALIQNVQTILQYAMTAARYVRIQPAVFSIAAVVNVGFCLWLIPAYGLKGAVMTAGAIYLLEIALSLGVMAYALDRVPQRPAPALVGEA